MKILHIDFTGTYNENMSYQENIIPKYNEEDGHEVIMLTTCYKWNKMGITVYTPPIDKIMNDGVRLIRMNHRKIINNFITKKIRKVDGVYKLLERISPEIIFFHGCQSFELLTIVRYIKLHSSVKLFIDNHADFGNSATNFLSLQILHKIIWRKIAQIAIPYATKFYGVLPARVDFLSDVYKIPKSKCELLLMGADDEKVKLARNKDVREKIRADLNISINDFLIISGGKIDLAKLQTINLMQAVHKLNILNLKLIIFGSVSEEIKEKFSSFVDNNRIQYIGWIDSAKTYDYFAASDLAVFPCGHSVLWEQAVGTGLPCLFKYWVGTTHIDIGGNCKFLYDDNSIEIENAINELIQHPDIYSNMKKIAEGKGIEAFSYKKISRKAIQYA